MDNLERIPITRDLRDYVQRYTYLKGRYQKIMSLINNSWKEFMREDEFVSSMNYYKMLCEETQQTFKLIIESIKDIYREGINGRPFEIDFEDSCIVINNDPKFDIVNYINHLHVSKVEQYGDFIARIFDENKKKDSKIRINGNHVINVTLQVTDACNMACTYCYQHHKGHHRMSYDTAKKFIDMILDSDRTNKYIDSQKNIGIVLEFIGGEPFLEIDLIEKISNYFIAEMFRRKHPWLERFMFSFSSNGLLYFDPKVQEYLNRYSGLVSLGISIDGNKKLHDSCRVDLAGNGTYDRAFAAAQDLLKRRGGENTKMTISPNNVHYIYDAVGSMIDSGYNKIYLNCVYEEGWNNEHAKELYYQLKRVVDYLEINNLLDKVYLSILDENMCKPIPPENNNNWCGGIGYMLAVDYKGDMFPCLRYMESSTGTKFPPYIIGNLDLGIANCKEHEDRIECMRCVTRRSQSTDECFNCPIGTGCGWCSAYNYQTFGTVNKRTTFTCCTHKARALVIAYYIKKKHNQFQLSIPEEWAIDIIGEHEYRYLVDYCNS